jgi:membrane associated rhomboid family serine protease
MPYDYQRPQLTFGFSSGYPRDVLALIAVVFVTYSMQFFEVTRRIVDLMRLTPLVFQMGRVWQLVTYPVAGAGDASVWVLLELFFLFFFARDVFARLGRRRFWWTLLVGALAAGAVGLLVDYLAPWTTQGSPASLVLVQGQHMLFVMVIAAFASLYRDATIMLMMIVPVRAKWFLPIELLGAFLGFLKTHDLAGFLGICAAIAVVWGTLTYGGLRRFGREWWLRTQGWWLRKRMGRLRKKRGFRVVDNGRRDPWLH